jgi:ELWxxDGT repeat protein
MLWERYLSSEAIADGFIPPQISELDGRVLFNSSWSDLSASDGTLGGTMVVKERVTPSYMIPFQDGLVWLGGSTDGTEEGTQGRSVPSHRPVDDLVVAGEFVFFVTQAEFSSPPNQLRKSAGMPGEGEVVVDLGQVEGASISRLTTVGGAIFFTVDTAHGSELWMTDGSLGGSGIVRADFLAFGSRRQDQQEMYSWPRRETWVVGSLPFLELDGILYFNARTELGFELWRSDGTEAGTFLVKDIRNGEQSSDPRDFTVIGDLIYFTADDGVHGRELWKSDGTASGTLLAGDIAAGAAGSDPTDLVAVDDAIYFAADDGIHGREIWRVSAAYSTSGDVNSDGKVDFADFLVLSANFGNRTTEGVAVGDLNLDGTVTFADFILLSARFTTVRFPLGRD